MKVVFMGTPEFAVYSLKALVESHHTVKAVFTQPDRPRGRGMKITPSPVKTYAIEQGIKVLQPEKLPDPETMKEIDSLAIDAFIVVAYGLKIPSELLFGPPFGAINVHGSLLPQYRGAAPMQRAIMNGDLEVGVTTMKMDEGWDTGDMLLKASIPLTPEMNLGDVHDRLAILGAELLIKTLDALEDGELTPQPQDDALATMAAKIREEDRWLDWSKPAWEIHNRIRALSPTPGALTTWEGKPLRIWASKWMEPIDAGSDLPHGALIAEERGQGLWIKTGDRPLLITEVQLEGGRRMTVPAFLAGRPFKKGAYLG